MRIIKCIATIILSSVFLFSSPASADSFPERPIELVVPYGAGGTTDVFARSFARVLGKYLPNEQRVVVVNKAGGASTIGMSVVADAKPDGYTLAFTPSGTIEIMQHYGRTSWDVDSFEPILSFFEIPVAINVLNSSEFNDYGQWRQYVDDNPGKFTYTTSGGTGGSTHLVMEQFKEATGLDIRHIPFEGQAAGQAAVLSGQVMGSFAIPDLHEGGDIRPLVFLSDVKPLGEVYDDTPFSSDLGIPVTISYPVGVLAPKGISKERAAVIHDAFKAAMDDPVVIKFYENAGLPKVYKDAATFAQGIRERTADNKRGLKQLGLIE